MGGFAKQVLLAIGGMILALSWWSLRDWACDGPAAPTRPAVRMPKLLFGGGGGTFSIDVEVSHPADLSCGFAQYDGSGHGPLNRLYVEEKLAPGRHRFDVDVPPRCSASPEVDMSDPPLGARIWWTVTTGGRVFADEENLLDTPLGPNQRFGMRYDIIDVGEGGR